MTTANAWKNTERRLQQPPTPLKDIPTRAFAKAQKTLNAGLVPPCWLMLVFRRLVTITAFNLLGDGIRDALDPRLGGAV